MSRLTRAWAIKHWNAGIYPEPVCRTRNDVIREFMDAYGLEYRDWDAGRRAGVHKPVKVLLVPADSEAGRLALAEEGRDG